MAVFIALLRGINVGKHNRVSMPELRKVLTDAGATDVATLLQSGNVVFTATGSMAAASALVSDALERQLGVRVPLIVRTAAQLSAALDADPFGDVATNSKTHLVGFFSEPPTPAARKALAEAVETRKAKGGKDAEDLFEMRGDHVYLWCPVNVHESIFATINWDKVLGVHVTMRNWDTATKLLALAG